MELASLAFRLPKAVLDADALDTSGGSAAGSVVAASDAALSSLRHALPRAGATHQEQQQAGVGQSVGRKGGRLRPCECANVHVCMSAYICVCVCVSVCGLYMIAVA